MTVFEEQVSTSRHISHSKENIQRLISQKKQTRNGTNLFGTQKQV